MTIRRRIALASAAAVAVTVVIISVVTYLGARAQVLGPIDDSLATRIEGYAAVPVIELFGVLSIGPDGSVRIPRPRFPRDVGGLFGRATPVEFDAAYVQIIHDGRVINIGEDTLELPLPNPASLSPDTIHFRSIWISGSHIRIAALSLPSEDTVLQVGRPLTEADETLRRFAWMLAIAGALGVMLAGGLGWIVARSAVKPIAELEDSIAGIANDRALGARLAVKGTDEVAQLATAFNELLSELDSAKQQQTRLVRDAGHELRTPLTALRTNLEILQRHDVRGEERMRMLNAAHAEVEELSALVAEVVDLATDRYEEEPISSVLLAEVVGVVAERTMRRNGRSIVIDADDTTIEGKPVALERAVANIVSNADKWSPPNADISVVVETGSVTVRDSGPGFSESDIGHVFERFYRSDTARSTPGSGLGLSIVEQIVTDHGGYVFARNRTDGSGAEVGFVLPQSAHSHSQISPTS
ncbi:MAG: HAMP domain-containing histidine kinase [Acidimicrobiia bacterium]|nr:HAMP domain-containing histidine kinase [Acidimicrobiia bacterium]